MQLYNNLLQNKLADKFSFYYKIDLSFIQKTLSKLCDIDSIIAISLVDIESQLLLVAYCDLEFPMNDFSKSSLEILHSIETLAKDSSLEKEQKIQDVIIDTKNDFSLSIPFTMIKNRNFLIYIQVQHGGYNISLLKKNVYEYIEVLKDKYV